jgi:quercetin dioxygenase-like cupin family protein
MKALAALLMLSFVFAGGRQDAVPVSAVPVSQEPHHHFKFENEFVRVYDVLVEPGDSTLYHTHSSDYVFVNLTNTQLKAQIKGSASVDLPVTIGQTVFTKATITHRVVNPDKVPFRNITVEILKTPRADPQKSPLAGIPGHEIVLDNDRVRIERLVLEPGQTTGTHTHTLMSLGIAVTAAKVAYQSEDGKEQVAEFKAGDFNWHPQPRTHSLKNIGKTRFEAIEIEWK